MCTLASVCTLTLSTVASAQPQNAGRIEVSGGIRWMGPIDFAEVPANETTNGGGTSALFRSQMALEGSVGGTATLGVRLSRLLLAEVAAAYNPTDLTTRITSDLEAPNATVDSPLTQFLVEGGIVAQVPMRRATSVRPFLTAGIGYLRQLNDGRTLVDTGSDYYVGGGLYYVTVGDASTEAQGDRTAGRCSRNDPQRRCRTGRFRTRRAHCHRDGVRAVLMKFLPRKVLTTRRVLITRRF